MRYKRIDSLGIDVSEICVGTWAIGGLRYGEVAYGDSIAAIRTLLDKGANIIDTAPAYGYGRSEMMVSDAIAGYDREKIIIVDKCGITPRRKSGAPLKDGRYKSIMRDCETSLGLLKMDYIDFYLIHHRDPYTPIEETMTALNNLKLQGLIKYIGLSNFNKEQIMEAQQFGKIDAIQMKYNMLDQGDRELFEWAHAQGMVTMTYGSLGSGILTGAIRELPEFADNDFRNTFYGKYFREPEFSKVQELLKLLDSIGEAHNAPTAQVTINWTSQMEFVTTALAGARNEKEAAENASTYGWSLSAEEIEAINNKIHSLGLDQ